MCYGTPHNQLSRTQYETVRSAVSLAGVKLPNYKTLKALLNRIKKKLGLKLVSTMSPLNNACYSLPLKDLLRLDLAKPHVAQNLTFYPEVSTDGVVKEFCHSDKWLNGWQTAGRMEIQQEEKVGLSEVGVVEISNFRNSFENIILPGGHHLKDLYGNVLYRINNQGEMVNGRLRNWSETKRLTEQIWKDSAKPNMASKVDALQKSYGLKDTMMQPFIENMRKVQRQRDINETKRVAMECEKTLGDRIFNPFLKLDGLQPNQKFTTAQEFLSLNERQLEVIHSCGLKNGQQVRAGDFVGVMTPYMNPSQWIGRIRAIWSPKIGTQQQSSPILSLDFRSISTDCHVFYGMCALKIHPHSVYVYFDEVRCSMNVQHNCYDSHCQTEKPRNPSFFPIHKTGTPLETHTHKDTDLYIINSGALYNGQAHREWAHIHCQPVTPEMWTHAIHVGLQQWEDNPK
ncbi:uncharacterized protein MELLADRAFT_112859 [Melampsora larici-populina 98AG31]|uniref:Uncharacterized protein n=1 Tax=Melampsora larici-populina (strain 98AG31 / pathotype 3-4-7) TaxID=747676 RepID=F4S7X4_MELLP|nr:uncharacterized protein MELLADRAFT_112859 [Melampsora larici-populina 98AG31]EGF99184.1 hypothetical protein MELLADRAFT_112859 [Melampsora larici-populina 98AG31]